MSELRERDGISPRALEFLILTVARTGAVIGARWPEIDFDTKMWTVPANRVGTKLRKLDHRVPLSDRAIEILEALPQEDDNDHIFIGAKPSTGLSNMSMLELVRGMRPGIVPHGFRSTFKDWASETTAYPNIVSEMALGSRGKGQNRGRISARGDLVAKHARLGAVRVFATERGDTRGCADAEDCGAGEMKRTPSIRANRTSGATHLSSLPPLRDADDEKFERWWLVEAEHRLQFADPHQQICVSSNRADNAVIYAREQLEKNHNSEPLAILLDDLRWILATSAQAHKSVPRNETLSWLHVLDLITHALRSNWLAAREPRKGRAMIKRLDHAEYLYRKLKE